MTQTDTQPDGEAVPARATGVAARINDQDRHCEIHRSDLRFFEATYGPALHLLNRIRSSEFDVELLRSVIDFATGERPREGESVESFRMRSVVSTDQRRTASAWIDEAFAARGPAHYAGLAGLILAAALFGLDPVGANFDDREV